MRCEKCHAELAPNASVCPHCGAPVAHNVEGFENTLAIKRELTNIIDQQGKDIIKDTNKFVSLLNDYIPEFEKERRLLRNMLNSNVLKNMIKEGNQKIAVMKAEKYMTSELFLSESAADFVLVCFTHILGWEYTPKHKEPEKASAADSGEKKKEKAKKSAPAVDINARIFRPVDAAKFRFRGNVAIPDGYTKIDSFCFDGFGFMRTIQLPPTMAAIGEYAFSECKRLKGIEFPPSIKVIKQGAFSQCAKLTMVRIPDGILDIEDNTFSFCRSLEIIDVPSSVSSIGAAAFSGCDSLRKLFLPESIKFIDAEAFSYCPSLVIRCYENSYVHKYCLSNGIKFETVAKGTAFNN